MRTIVAVTIAVLSLFVTAAFAQQNTREIFERARMLDESNQNLSEAIKLYSQVVSQSNEQRALAARAQYRIGVLYERLGRKAEAQKAYQTVVNHYADQSEVASRARAKIPAAAVKNDKGRTKSVAPNSPTGTGMSVRQVWAGPFVDLFSEPSEDGRYLPVTDWETGDLGIRDLVEGKTRRITNKGTWAQSSEFALFPMLSPDGKQIAYDWFNKDYAWELRIMGTDGSAPRVLYQGTATNSDFVIPGGWTPDGKYIAVMIAKDRSKGEIDLMSATDGSLRVLKTLSPANSLGMLRLSPDGRYIAYDMRQKPDSKESDIFLFNTETKQEVPLVQHPANDFSPTWTLDGKNILFASDRTGTLGFWLQPVAEGKPKGKAELVKGDLGSVWPMGFTRNGSFYYGLDSGMNDVYVASIDFHSGKVLEAPTPLSQRFVGSNSVPVWSPDGKYLAYVSQRGPGTTSLTSRDKVLVIRSLDTGQEREVAVNLSLINRPQWWPDGGSILVGGNDKQSRVGIYRVDVKTGGVTVLVQEEGNNYRFPMLSPDGKTLYYLRINFPKGTWSIRARDLQGGGENEILSVSSPRGIANLGLSPDGQELAFIVGDRTKPQVAPLKVMPTRGGEAREVCQITGDLGTHRLIWTPDGQKILFTLRRQDPAKPVNSDQTFELWQVSAAGGQPQKVGLAMERLRDLNLHPDGKRLAFAAGQSKPEVWVMENFLPEAKPKRAVAARR
jgi:Tol biopolymer transport system component